MRFRSFSTRLSLNVLLVVAILFAVSLFMVAVSFHLVTTKEATKSATSVLRSCKSDIEKSLNSVECAVQNTAWYAGEHFGESEYLYHVTEKLVAENPFILGSAIAFDTNRFPGRFSYSPYSYVESGSGSIKHKQLGESYNYFESDWFTECERTGKPVWSEPYFDKGGADCMMTTYSFPIKDSEGRVLAVITADVPLDWFAQRVGEIRPYEHSFTALVSRKGKFLSRSNHFDLSKVDAMGLAQQMKDPRVVEMTRQMLDGKEGTSVFRDRLRGSFSVYGPLENGWKLMITCQYRDVAKNATKMNVLLLVIGIIGLLLLFLICNRIIRDLTQPLTEFSVSAMSMAKGNFQAQLPTITSKDELLKLNNSFKYLQQSITTYIRELRVTTSANQRMESELNIAQAIQQGMLPRQFPDHDRFSIYAMLTPAKEVGGDLYDFVVKDNTLYFVVGDVSGKGVPAALVMAITQAACRFFFKMGIPMDKVVGNLNSSVADGNETGMFATLFAGSVNLDTLEMDFCNAGHNHIVVVPAQADQPAYFLHAKPNLAVGLFPDFQYEKEHLELTSGTTLVLYTDGVTEAETFNKNQFGDDRLLQVTSAKEFRTMTSQQKVDSIYNAVKIFTADNEQNDDITLLVITIK